LLSVGGCEIGSQQLTSHRKLGEEHSGDQWGGMVQRKTLERDSETGCSIRQDRIASTECLQKCYNSIESIYDDELEKLTITRHKRISKNHENKETVLGKLLVTRAAKLSTAFARCKCKHGDQNLSHCVLRLFLDNLVTENENQFEIKGTFGRHTVEVETWFQSNLELLCDASKNIAENCRDEC